jgi:hypothetical protein
MTLRSQVFKKRARAQIFIEQRPRTAVQINKSQTRGLDSCIWLPDIAQKFSSVFDFGE